MKDSELRQVILILKIDIIAFAVLALIPIASFWNTLTLIKYRDAGEYDIIHYFTFWPVLIFLIIS